MKPVLEGTKVPTEIPQVDEEASHHRDEHPISSAALDRGTSLAGKEKGRWDGRSTSRESFGGGQSWARGVRSETAGLVLLLGPHLPDPARPLPSLPPSHLCTSSALPTSRFSLRQHPTACSSSTGRVACHPLALAPAVPPACGTLSPPLLYHRMQDTEALQRQVFSE